MKLKREINEQILRERINEVTGGQGDFTRYQVVYAWRKNLWRGEENCALAFHLQKASLWVFGLERPEMREIPLAKALRIAEGPCCEYLFFYLARPFRERFCVPFFSGSTEAHYRCNQVEAAGRFHFFCKKQEKSMWRRRRES